MNSMIALDNETIFHYELFEKKVSNGFKGCVKVYSETRRFLFEKVLTVAFTSQETARQQAEMRLQLEKDNAFHGDEI